MNKIKYVRNSDVSQIIIKSVKGQIIDERALYAAEKNQLTGFLNLSLEKSADSFRLIYNTQNYSTLKEYLDSTKDLDLEAFLNLLSRIVQPLQCLQDADFKCESVLLNINYCFVDNAKQNFYYVFVPVIDPKGFGSLSDFLLMVITYSNFASGADIDAVNEFMEIVKSLPDFSLFDLCDCISYMSNGEPLSDFSGNRGMRCPGCGSPITGNIKFCANCGFNIEVFNNNLGNKLASEAKYDGSKVNTKRSVPMPVDLMGLPSKPVQIKITEPPTGESSENNTQSKPNTKSKPVRGNKFIPDKEIHRVKKFWVDVNAAHNDSLENEQANAGGYSNAERSNAKTAQAANYTKPNNRMPQYTNSNMYSKVPPSQYGNINMAMTQYPNQNGFPQAPMSQYGNMNAGMPQYPNQNGFAQAPMSQYGDVNTGMTQFAFPNGYPQAPMSQYANVNNGITQFAYTNGYPQAPMSQYANVNNGITKYPNGYPQPPMSMYGNVNTGMAQYPNQNGYPQAQMSQYGDVNNEITQYPNQNGFPEAQAVQHENTDKQATQYPEQNSYEEDFVQNDAVNDEHIIDENNDVELTSLDYGVSHSGDEEVFGEDGYSDSSALTSLNFGSSQDCEHEAFNDNFEMSELSSLDYSLSYDSEVYDSNEKNDSSSLADSYAGDDSEASSGAEVYLIRYSTGEKILVDKPEFIIGRMPESVDYCVSDNSAIGRQHLRITQNNCHYYVCDLNSTNGTLADNNKLTPNINVEVYSGSLIKLANEEFEFVVKDFNSYK